MGHSPPLIFSSPYSITCRVGTLVAIAQMRDLRFKCQHSQEVKDSWFKFTCQCSKDSILCTKHLSIPRKLLWARRQSKCLGEFIDNSTLHERRLHIENKRQVKHRGKADLIGEVDVGEFQHEIDIRGSCVCNGKSLTWPKYISVRSWLNKLSSTHTMEDCLKTDF